MLVIGIAMIVTVLGMAAITLSRVSARSVTQGNDWEAAGDLAFAATEHAISYINVAAAASPAGWRSGYTSSQTVVTQAMGRGTFSWALKDETDGLISEDYLRAFRIYGIGKVGAVTRVYSVQVMPGGAPLDVLRTGIHSSSTITLTGNAQAINGPFSSNSSISLSGTVSGSIEAASTSGSASGTQTITVPAPNKTMPSSSIYTDLLQTATAVNCGSTLQNCLLSPVSNPYGAVNSSGIYSISVNNNSNLTITNCRIFGTLLINLNNKGTLKIQGPVEIEPANTSYPTMVVIGQKATISMSGSNTWLSESAIAVNFNPPGASYAGVTNTTTTDDYPPQYRGVFHFLCGTSSTVQLDANTYINGTLITDSPVKTTAQSTFVQNPLIYASPPFGYQTGNAMTEVPGSWRWDTLP